jgi:hypothetical protein
MAALIQLVQDLSTPVKLGWALCALWFVAQVLWYRRGRLIPVRPQAEGNLVSTQPSTQHAAMPAAVPSQLELPTGPLMMRASERRQPHVDQPDALIRPI